MKKILFSILLFVNIGSIAQLKNISFDHLMVENGMPENYAIDLCQDSNGYIWCGTQKGLMRYDGYSIKVYKQQLAGKDNSVNAIGSVFVDKKGVVWAGTISNYLLRYNALADTFMIYKPDTVKNGTFSHITKIFEDGQNTLWLRISNPANPAYPLERFDEKTGKFFPVKMSTKENADIPSDNLTSLFSDKEGRIWIGTENGVYTYNNNTKKFDRYLVSADTSKKRVLFNLYEAPSEPGILYMSVGSLSGEIFIPKGFVRYGIANNKATFYYLDASNPNSFPNDATSSFFEDSKKRLWIGTNNSLIYFDRDKNIFQSFSIGINNPASFDIIKEDMDGNFWIVGENSGQGLINFYPELKIFNRYYAEPDRADGLASNAIEQVFADKAGNIWLAFRVFGIERINRMRSRFTSFTYNPKDPTGYPGGITNSFAQSKDGIYWLATSQGLVRYDSQKGFTKVKLFEEAALANAFAMSILADKNGFIWFRYQTKGLVRYDPQTGSVVSFKHDDKDKNSLSNNLVSCLYEDHNGELWVGTDGGGLCRYNKEKGNFTCFPYINNSKVKYTGAALDDASVSSIHEDEQGRLWISTNLGGLNLMNKEKGTFTSYLDESAGLANIDGIENADSGRLWLSSYFLGLTMFDPAKGTTVKAFNEKNGLLSDILTWLKKDKEGNLWIGSARGLSRLVLKTNAIINYTNMQGLPNNVLYWPLVDKEGEIFIGCKFGFFNFFPKDMKPNQVTPIINLESISYPGIRSYNKTDTMLVNGRLQISLEHNQNKITFHYTGIHFENPLFNNYKYKLEGYDENWIMGGDSRYATYTNLSPGTYTFYVKSANMDGVWNDTPASLVVIIYPPWWQTWWAYTLYFFVFIFALWGFIRWRLNTVKKEKVVLEEKVTTRTNELQQSLNDLKATQAQLIQSEKMASLGELTAGIAHEIQNPLNFVNNFSDVNKELVDELEQEISKGNYTDAKAIAKDIKDNEEKINHHGKRADAIVKGMLQHSRASSGQKELTDINVLADEYLRLAYHGLRAKDKSFNATMKTDLDETISKLNIVPQEIGRVILNLITNAFYVVTEKKKLLGDGYEPIVIVSTKTVKPPLGGLGVVEIRVKDNGKGIPQKILDKIFQPFFTTKPTGQGTGLGLSLSYDIIKAHGGEIKVETKEGEGSEFIIQLPVV